MDSTTKAQIVEQMGKFLGDGLRVLINRPVKKKAENPATKEYPEQMKALEKLGHHTIVALHENGDATVKSQGKLYVVTTSGNVFSQVEPDAMTSQFPVPTSHFPLPEPSASKSIKEEVPQQPFVARQNYLNRPKIELPTREETSRELKRRLARELYKAEMDLSGGLLIAGKPCDCLDVKHSLMLEAASEEMVSQEPSNSVYLEIIKWIKDNQHKVTVAAIESGQYKSEYPMMASQFKDFRKRVMGTAAFSAMEKPGTSFTLEDAKKMAAEAAAQEVERKWHSAEKK